MQFQLLHLTWLYCKNLLHLKNVTVKYLRSPAKEWHLMFGTSRTDLTLFDATIPLDVKRRIVQKLSKEGIKNPPKIAVVDLKETRTKNLDDFASMNFMLFTRLGLPTSFLEANSAAWPNIEDFKKAKAIVGALNSHFPIAIAQYMYNLHMRGNF